MVKPIKAGQILVCPKCRTKIPPWVDIDIDFKCIACGHKFKNDKQVLIVNLIKQ